MTRKRPEREKSFRSFIISGRWEKLVPAVLSIMLLIRVRDMLVRPLWFDEALTVLNFALLETPAKIYNSYIIPNNQIIHTILLHWWIKLFSLDFLRFLPLVCGIATLVLLWQMRRKSSNVALFTVLYCLAASFSFGIYATALRGYIFSCAMVAGGTWMVSHYLENGKKRFLAGWFIFSLLGVGTIPGTLAGLAAALLYAVGNCRWEIFKKWRLYLAGLMPVAAFAIFYLPIKEQLLRCAALGEGWNNGTMMLLALTMGIIFTFLPVLLPALAGQIRKHRLTPEIFHLAIWLLPVPAAYVFKVAPFPRVFLPVFPIFALLLANGVKDFYALIRKKKGKRYLEFIFIVIGIFICLWSGVCSFEKFRQRIETLHPAPGGQPDFIDCHFVRKDFSPRTTALEFKKYFPELPTVYTTFDSDPWALMFAFMECGVRTRIVFDGPAGKVYGIPPVAIKHFTENKSVLEKRFRCKFNEVLTTNNHTFLVPEK